MIKRGLVVVIVGGSSGIGLAIARALAASGANLALAARNEPALGDAAEDCRRAGAEGAITSALDIRDETRVAALGREALAHYGKIDVWINCAAQLGFGRLDEMPPQVFREIIETNVIGMANGARTAVEIFRMQGYGHLINFGSVLGRVTEPLVSAYSASKFAVEGLTNVIQQELRDEPRIHVSLALPWAIDTPIYQRAANFSGRAVRTIWPVYGPERVATAVCALIEHPRKQALIGPASYLAAFGNRISHRALIALAGWIGPRMQVEPTRHGAQFGALRDARGDHAMTGGWRAYWRRRIGKLLRGSSG